MKPTVYIETTVIGYLAMRPSKSLQLAAKQEITREWWALRRTQFELFTSQYVVDECSAGDSTAAAERLVFLDDIPLLSLSPEVDSLATRLIDRLSLPRRAELDAFHIAAAAASGIEYLLTWNCTHIANPSHRNRIDDVCREMDFLPPVICTPYEICGIQHGN